MSRVVVSVLTRGAIYVDNMRITARVTKWGKRRLLAEFECDEVDVVRNCISRGFLDNVHSIVEEPYRSHAVAALQEVDGE